MNQQLNDLLNLFFRWGHIIAGITWIGLLYFFNWINGPFQGKMDGPTKKAVNPELLPRALFWFRWGAAWTWITGILLAGIVYYQERKVLFDDQHWDNNPWLWLAITLVTWAVGFVIYNAIMKSLANKVVGAAICLVLYAGVWALLERVGHYSGRALYIHGGATFGTTMALNVWMVIWPYQKKIITALKAGNPLPATDPIVTTAALRSRHNTYMSVPLVFFMISNHYFAMYSNPYHDICAAGMIVIGFVAVWLLYAKAPKVPGI
ncbi:MAG TPA: urate hydroxylase PuuD [Thermoanaerobaculia bacterium]|nr:urate hydroxylase PuuD [Thermoanaerobaculia bacterium]